MGRSAISGYLEPQNRGDIEESARLFTKPTSLELSNMFAAIIDRRENGSMDVE